MLYIYVSQMLCPTYLTYKIIKINVSEQFRGHLPCIFRAFAYVNLYNKCYQINSANNRVEFVYGFNIVYRILILWFQS